jgi:hypothetical protein
MKKHERIRNTKNVSFHLVDLSLSLRFIFLSAVSPLSHRLFLALLLIFFSVSEKSLQRQQRQVLKPDLFATIPVHGIN